MEERSNPLMAGAIGWSRCSGGSRVWLNVIGWTATAVFSSSYFFKEAATLRRIQAMAATLWVLYGILIHSAPVVVANLIVGVAAVYTSLRLVLNKKTTAEG
jgi:hypothetical protein